MNKIKLSRRLQTIANLIQGKVVVDVGCDNARLAVWLAQNKNCFVYAVDEKEGPLLNARKNIEKFDVSDKVKLIKSSGVANEFTGFNGAFEYVVAGMGGPEIEKIVCDCNGFFDSKIRLILQPQSNVWHFANRLCLNGFKIEKEVAVVEKGKGYLIFVMKFYGVKIKIKPNQIFGFSESFFESIDARAYAEIQKHKARVALSELKKAKLCNHVQKKANYFKHILDNLS